MSKFLFVSSYDLRRNTSGNIRVVSLMKGLHDNGHVVHCLFIPTSHESDKEIYTTLIGIDKLITYPKIELTCNQPINKEGARKKKTFKEKIQSFLIHTYMRLTVYDVFENSFRRLSEQNLQELDDEYDYIVSSAEPRSSHKLAKKVIRLKGYQAKWIQYWGDPMSNDVASTKIFKGREAKEERRLIALSDYSIYTNPCAASYMKEKYPELSEKINWIPTSDVKNAQVETYRGDTNKIGYFGDYRSAYRNLEPFYQACLENGFDATIIGDADKQLDPSETIKVYGRMTRAAVNKYEHDCGILIVLENISKTGVCIQVPGKLYHYGLTNKYILVITESNNIAAEYEKFNRYIFVPNDKEKIVSAIKGIQEGKYESLNISPVDSFKRERIGADFINIIQ